MPCSGMQTMLNMLELLGLSLSHEMTHIHAQHLYCMCVTWKWWEHQTKHFDCHGNLPTDVLTYEHHKKVLVYLFGVSCREQLWDVFGICWIYCYSSFLQTHSLGEMKLPDLLVDNDHGPHDATGHNKYMLAMISHPFVHKTQHMSGCF